MTSAPLVAVRRWNTPQILKGGRALILALHGLLLIAILVATGVHRKAMKTVGVDSAPSIIAAQQIKSALADMDANAANELLGPAGQMPNAVKGYETRRREASRALIEAARNITFDTEQAPIESLQVNLGTYEQRIQRARDLHQTADPAAIAAYRDAARLMDQTLLPAADALDKANNDELDKTYNGQSLRSSLSTTAVIVCGFLALLALGAAQFFLSTRTHRTLNPLLLAATLLTLGLTAYALHAMSAEQRQLKVATEDAFASIRALLRARAVAFQANADESRYLLVAQRDPPAAAEYQRDFFSKAASLATLPPGTSLDDAAAAAARKKHVDGFTGFLADELNNITFDGEREAALKSLVTWQKYLAIDTDIRRLEHAGQHAQAVALCLSSDVDQSDWAFDQFDRALLATLAINRNAFDAAVKDGLGAVGALEIKAAVAVAVLAVLTFLGFAARIREYD